MNDDLRGSKGQPVYAILRWDGYQDFSDPTDYVTGTKAYESAEEAEAECRRLNQLNGDKQTRYFVRLVRLRPVTGGQQGGV